MDSPSLPKLNWPVMTLLLLAPMIGEVLSGATRISFIIVLIPEIMVWGCGALLIRELVLHWRGGWISTLLLGLALSVAEEFIIQQTSIAPLPWLGSSLEYGRAWGVNWIYFLYMLGYESVWIVLVPVQLTHLIYPERRSQAWLRRRGLVISGLVFLLGSFVAWFTWTQQARPLVFHVPKYLPPAELILTGLVLIALLVFFAWKLRSETTFTRAKSKAPQPWLAGLGVFALGMPWWALITLVFVPNPPVAPVLAGIAGFLWAVLAGAVIRHWSCSRGWSELHGLATVFSAIVVCMLGGFAGSSAWPKLDLIGKAVLNIIAIVGLLALAGKIRTLGRQTNDHAIEI